MYELVKWEEESLGLESLEERKDSVPESTLSSFSLPSFSHFKVVRVALVHRASARALTPSAEILLPKRLSKKYFSIS